MLWLADAATAVQLGSAIPGPYDPLQASMSLCDPLQAPAALCSPSAASSLTSLTTMLMS
jgi:hypothetical protein